MADKPSVIRPTDEAARRLARTLLRGARFVAIAVLDPDNGFPAVSRVLLGTDEDGAAVILVSGLSAHTRALSHDPRVSLLAGEPAKGDPLAHPRLSVQALAEPVVRDSDEHMRIRARFLARHPKAKLYIDFPDFRFFRLTAQSASLNGGFGRAYLLAGSDFAIRPPQDFTSDNSAPLQDLVVSLAGHAAALAYDRCGAKAGKWQICGIDWAGIDLRSGDLLLRYEYRSPVGGTEDIISDLSNTEYPIP